ncbi:exodeoxyribonuclease VII small subunit [Flavonifractor sp. An100]|uniref:exodeoxyribonuclease VII small subunit n=1 Tax=Flavonifractor sp. An100 TaxID=1965538 RepID=UPI000B3AD068|nr:exodeoxyribonuclease VII small subunit [Flavonifractor sp. An100]OUQ80195.1 exodeoxyribonuclease VII small subunit [Flavonifractor sp. An100]
MATKKKLNFEDSMARLEEIVSLLERGDAPLEQAMALFEEGAKLLRECTKQLDEAEQKVTLLTAGENGQPEERPFQEEKD